MSARTTAAPAGQDTHRADTDLLVPLLRIFDEGFATGSAAIVDEVCAPDLVEHQFGLAGRGETALAHVRSAIEDLHRMVPDGTFTLEDSAVSGDTVWIRARLRGTATGPFFGPPSGRPVDVLVFDQARIVDGRIAEHWGVPNRFAVLAQTGILERLVPAVAG